MANDLEFSLGLDVSPMQRAGAAVAHFGDETVKVLNRKFTGADLFKGILQGVGIASVEHIAEKLIEPFKASAESAQRIAEWTDKAADATLKLIGLRQTDAQQLTSLEKQYARINAEAQKPAEVGFWRSLAGGVAARLGLGGLSAAAFKNGDAEAEKNAKAESDLAQKGLEIETKKAEIKRKADEAEASAIKERATEADKRQAADEKLAAFDREQRLAKMNDDQKIATIEKERRAVTAEIAKYDKFTREGGELTAEGATKLLSLKEKQKALEEEIAAATEHKAKSEQLIGEQIESNIDKWKEFTVLISSSGRGDKDLSDRELAKKIKNLNSDIFSRESSQFAGLGFDAGDAAAGGRLDPLLWGQRNNLSLALSEQRLRTQTRTNVARFGEARAFQMFGGSEAQFAAILRETQDNSKLASDISDIRDVLVTRGIRTLPLGSD